MTSLSVRSVQCRLKRPTVSHHQNNNAKEVGVEGGGGGGGGGDCQWHTTRGYYTKHDTEISQTMLITVSTLFWSTQRCPIHCSHLTQTFCKWQIHWMFPCWISWRFSCVWRIYVHHVLFMYYDTNKICNLYLAVPYLWICFHFRAKSGGLCITSKNALPRNHATSQITTIKLERFYDSKTKIYLIQVTNNNSNVTIPCQKLRFFTFNWLTATQLWRFYNNKTKLYPITTAHKLWFFTFNSSSTLKVLRQQNKNLSNHK